MAGGGEMAIRHVLWVAIGLFMVGCTTLSPSTTTTITPKSALVATHDTFTLPSPPASERLTLVWDDPHNASEGARSYYVYYWQPDWNNRKRINVGSQTTYTLANLEAGRIYTFAVTVHDGKGGRESAFSEVISHQHPANNTNGVLPGLTIPAPGVLANDSYRNRNDLTVQLVRGPDNGTLSLNTDGSFTYLPYDSFQRRDRFTYHVRDGLQTSNVAIVTIRTTPESSK